MTWTTFIAWRFFRSNKKISFINCLTYISLFTTTCYIAFLILIFGLLRGFYNQYEEKLIQEYGMLQIISNNNNMFNTKDFKQHKISEQFIINEQYNCAAKIPNCSYPFFLTSKNNIPYKSIGVHKTIYQYIKDLNVINIIIIDPSGKIYKITCDQINIAESYSPYIIQMNSQHIKDILNTKDRANYLVLTNKNKNIPMDQIDKIINEVQQDFTDFKFISIKTIASFFLNILNLNKNICYIILLILFILNILINLLANTMFILSKKKSIQILKTQGAKKTEIISIFNKYNMINCLISSVLGLLIGCLLTKNINQLILIIEKILKLSILNATIIFNQLPVIIDIKDILLIVFFNISTMFLISNFVSYKTYSIEFF